MPLTLSLVDKAPDFSLPATDGEDYYLQDFDEADNLVVFYL